MSVFITLFSFLCLIGVVVVDYKSKVFDSPPFGFLANLYWSDAIFIIGLFCFLISVFFFYCKDVESKEVKVRNIDDSYGVNCYIVRAKKMFAEGSYVTIYQRRCNGHGHLPRIYAVGVCMRHPTSQNLNIIEQVSYGKDTKGDIGDRSAIFSLDRRFAKELVVIPYLKKDSNVIKGI